MKILRGCKLCLLTALALIASATASCSRPGGVLSQNKMARVLADIHIAESVAENNRTAFNDDSTKRVLKQSVLLRHKVTTEEFDSSLRWYGYNLDRYIEVYDKVIAIIEEDIADVQANVGSASEVTSTTRMLVEGDSVDVWPDVRYRRFAPTLPTDIIAFSLSSDQNWEKGDIYKLSVRLTGTKAPTELTLVTEYQDGSKDYNSVSRSGDGWHELTLALNPEKTASNVFGEIRYDAPEGNVAFADSISLYRSRKSVSTEKLRNVQKTLSNTYGR